MYVLSDFLFQQDGGFQFIKIITPRNTYIKKYVQDPEIRRELKVRMMAGLPGKAYQFMKVEPFV